MTVFLMVLAVALLGVVGDVLINQWAKTYELRWWMASVPFWLLMATMFGFVLRQKHYSFSIALIIILLIHSGLVLAWDVLVERAVLTPMQWGGVVAGLLAITLMEVGRK